MVLMAAAVRTALAGAPDNTVLHHADLAHGRPEGVEKGFYQVYVTEFGFEVAVGDRLTLALPLGSSVHTTTASTGALSVESTALEHAYYTTVANGRRGATAVKAALSALGGAEDPADYMAPHSLAGAEVVVSRIKLAGTRMRPWVWAECTFVNESDRANTSGIITVGGLDEALGKGEVADDQFVPRHVAVARLAEAHELLQIGVYTAAQYEAERLRYLPFIAADGASGDGT